MKPVSDDSLHTIAVLIPSSLKEFSEVGTYTPGRPESDFTTTFSQAMNSMQVLQIQKSTQGLLKSKPPIHPEDYAIQASAPHPRRTQSRPSLQPL
ncbi:hypothetical protein BDZ89DRAFT_1056042 [Hymenopellis radicata]|nr:hypothetical protein BDZ89DRAFT_1056042 [Hymenopellis radicata]